MITKLNIPLPEVRQHNYWFSRLYEDWRGCHYFSITTLLGRLPNPGLDKWRNMVGEEEANVIASRAARRGDVVHNAMEQYILTGEKIAVPIVYKKLVDDFYNVLDKNLSHYVEVEKALVSHKLGVAGMVDLIGVWNGEAAIIDFKTSNKKKEKDYIKNYFLQATSYAIMFQEHTGIPIDKIVILIAVEEDEIIQIFEENASNYKKELVEVLNSVR